MAITLQEAKEYLRVGYDDDNDYITELIEISEQEDAIAKNTVTD